MKYLKLFEDYVETIKKPKYEHKGTIINFESLGDYGIPIEIQEIMKKWPVIYKSPYGTSFYSSTNIGWGYKPHKSYRVSDHWNFTTRGKKHCETNKSVANNSYITIAQYDKSTGKYNIILSVPTNKHTEFLDKKSDKLKYLLDPETLRRKREFKTRIGNKEIQINITYDGVNYEGIVRKLTTTELKIEDNEGNLIFNDNYIEYRKITHMELYDKQGNSVKNEMEWKINI